MMFCIAGCENILERVLMVIVVELFLLRMRISVENVICYALKDADRSFIHSLTFFIQKK